MSAIAENLSGLDAPLAPRQKNISICEIDKELGTKRSKLTRLIAKRDREQEQLRAARRELEDLTQRVNALEESVTEKNQSVFVLLPEVEGLLELREKIQRRAVLALKDQELSGEGAGTVYDKRASTRTPLAVEVSMQSETNFYVGFSENISEGGLFVATHDTLPMGTSLPVTFVLPGRPEPISCLGEVAWVREYTDDMDQRHGSSGMGLRFVGLSADDQAAIARFVEEREPLFFPEYDDLS